VDKVDKLVAFLRGMSRPRVSRLVLSQKPLIIFPTHRSNRSMR